MVEKYSIRTDLALEDTERFEEDNVEIPGVVVEEDWDQEREIRITTVRVETEKGARVMGKPVGTYVTLEAPGLAVPDEEYHREISIKLARFLKTMLPEKRERKVLVAGLGNRDVTPDALGPMVADNLQVTRHMIQEYGRYAMAREEMDSVSAIAPGVMGQTGMETVEIIRGIVEETQPDAIIAVDALAARNSRRLNRTVQIADTGIRPGSGVGNHRSGITGESVGVPVIAIGVPTVVDAATIVSDTMENLLAALETSEALRGVGVVMQGYSAAEKYELVRELIAPHLNGMFVTPKDIDETMRRLSYTISEGLNILFSGEEV